MFQPTDIFMNFAILSCLIQSIIPKKGQTIKYYRDVSWLTLGLFETFTSGFCTVTKQQQLFLMITMRHQLLIQQNN
jgi:hypothetical protein